MRLKCIKVLIEYHGKIQREVAFCASRVEFRKSNTWQSSVTCVVVFNPWPLFNNWWRPGTYWTDHVQQWDLTATWFLWPKNGSWLGFFWGKLVLICRLWTWQAMAWMVLGLREIPVCACCIFRQHLSRCPFISDQAPLIWATCGTARAAQNVHSDRRRVCFREGFMSKLKAL